jgi:hypothetical protein
MYPSQIILVGCRPTGDLPPAPDARPFLCWPEPPGDAALISWHCTENLILDRDGDLWYAARLAREMDGSRSFLKLGRIERVVDEGILTEDLQAEARKLLGLWYDRCDDCAEQIAACESVRGMRRWSA